ncbi:MAG: translocation/assembly module TamB domain-containing protein [Flavobacterium sp.]|nr:translocation/assembly module TamB domain-containing protein [Candidatus Neoflavobacterium equi]
MNNFIKTSLRIVFWTVAGLVALLLALAIAIQIPYVQNKIKDFGVHYLEDKLQTKVALDHIYIGFPNVVQLDGLYLEDQDRDTLVYADKLKVNLALFDLLKSKATIKHIGLKGFSGLIKRDNQGKFNFDYIIDAFKTEDDKEEEPSNFQISLNTINLEKFAFKFKDQYAGNDVDLKLHTFYTKVTDFDIVNLNFGVPDIAVDGLNVKLKRSIIAELADKTEEVVDSLSKNVPLKIKLDKIALSNFDVAYADAKAGLQADVLFKKLNTQVDVVDLEKMQFKLDDLLFDSADVHVQLLKKNANSKTSSPSTKQQESTANALLFELQNAALNQVNIQFDDWNKSQQKKGMDFGHLKLSDLNLETKKLSYTENRISGTVKEGNFKEKSGFILEALKTDFLYAAQEASLKNLYVKTPNTLLRDEVVLQYANLDQLTKNLGQVGISARLNKSKVGFKDILLLVPTLSQTPPFKGNPNGSLYVDSKVSGMVDDLYIQKFELSGLSGTRVIASGHLKNATQGSTAYFDLNVNQLSTNRNDILGLLPKGTLPNNIQLPQQLSVQGAVKGQISNFFANLKLQSSFGGARLKAILNQQVKNQERFDVDAALNNFNVGALLKNKDIGKVTVAVKAVGTSFDPGRMNADFTGKVEQAVYNGYTYKHLNLDGEVVKGNYIVHSTMEDPNAQFNLSAIGNLNQDKPSINLNGQLSKVDLYAMNLVDKPMAIKGNIKANFPNLNTDDLNGSLRIYDFAFADGKSVFPMDSLKLDIVSADQKNAITLRSQILDADVEGQFHLLELPGYMQQTVSEYYQLGAKPTANARYKKRIEQPFFDASIKIKNDKLLYKLLPNLKSFQETALRMQYNHENKMIALNGLIPELQYGTNQISNVGIDVKTVDSTLNYNLTVAKLSSPSYQIKNMSLDGSVNDNKVGYNLGIKDDSGKQQYQIAGTFAQIKDLMQLRLNPNGLTLNYDNWSVADGNKIEVSDAGIFADQFQLQNDNTKIVLQSLNTKPNSPMSVVLENFKLETLTHIIKKDSLLAKGTINGTAELRDLKKTVAFIADLNITDLEVMESKIGDVKVEFTNTKNEGNYNARVFLTGNGNEAKILGLYNPKKKTINMRAFIDKLQMQSVQGFASGFMKDTQGYLSGNLAVRGTLDAPSVKGTVKFNDVSLNVIPVNAVFQDINSSIAFTDTGINFDKFTITDINKNKLTLDGDVLTSNYKEFGFDLTLKGNNFQIMNSTVKENDFYYGKMFVDVNLTIKGDLDLPVVDGTLKVDEKTDFNFVLPQQDPSLVDREGIVEFIDQDNVLLNETLTLTEDLKTSKIRGANINVRISVNKEAKITLVIDKVNGDHLTLKGEADLTGGIDPSGKTSLTGTYETKEGSSYDMSFNFIKRKFNIKEGSTITWTGEPTTANVDITAIYKSNTSPIDLLDDQLSAMASSERNQFKQRIPIETHLMMKGELLKPTISFDIKMPEENYNVSTEVIDATEEKLSQIRGDQAELNKQVIALLVLNRFIGENPFASSSGVSAESMARQSVSKILSDQLNNLATELVSGVELNFDLESQEDYSSGEKENRTDLNVGVSKKLFDDRLKITIGSSFGIEGEDRQNEQSTNIAGDVTAEYTLTEDGRYMVRAYRKNRYQVTMQGQVVETGVGFVITMSYNKFKQIFENRKKNQRYRAAQMEERRQRLEREATEREALEKLQKAEKGDTQEQSDPTDPTQNIEGVQNPDDKRGSKVRKSSK